MIEADDTVRIKGDVEQFRAGGRSFIKGKNLIDVHRGNSYAPLKAVDEDELELVAKSPKKK